MTISRFRGEAAEVMAQLFAQVLVLCARLGMGQVGVVAMDSVKIASDASLAANRTEAGLRELAAAAAAEHAATDASEDALYGPERRGDELPEELIDPRSRAARIAQALQQLQADTAGRVKAAERNRQRQQRARERRQAQLEASGRRRRRRGGAPVMGRPPTEIRVEVLTENLAAVRARHQATIDRWLAGGKRGYPPRPIAESAKVKRVQAALDRAIAERDAHQRLQASWAMKTSGREPKRNVNDPESRMMPLRGGGWVQGYNCQAVTSSDGLIIATSVGNNQSDATAFTTTMDKAVAAAALIDAHRPPPVPPSGIGVLLADAGYLSEDNLSAPGPDRLIAIGKSHDLAMAARKDPTTGPPPPDATPIEAMAHRLRTPEGHDLYKQRRHIAETPFAHAKHNLGFRRFTSRGKARATAEFNFHALVHNLFKAISAGHLVPTPT